MEICRRLKWMVPYLNYISIRHLYVYLARCDARNYRENGDHECCSRSSPCAENEGDCDSDDDCQGDLVCGQDNCPSNWGSSEADCCKSINVNLKTTTDYEDYYAYDSLGLNVNLKSDKTTTNYEDNYEDYYAEAPW